MRERGFSLLEVMIALALLGLALTVLIKSAAGSIFNAEQAHMLGIATDLARGKMYDIEEQLMKDGFTDTDQSQTDLKPFDVEGWPTIFYAYKVEVVEMPSWDDLQQLALGHAKAKQGSGSGSGVFGTYGSNYGSQMGSQYGSAFGTMYGSAFGSDMVASGFGSDALTGFQNSALGGMLGMMGGSNSSSSSVAGAQGGALIQSQYSMFQQILKVSVRKVTLVVKWKALGSDRDMRVVAFFTDPAAMDLVLNGLGAVDTTGTGSGSAGSGTGSGSGNIKAPTLPPVTH